jgi:hypothetical protein
MIDRIVDVSMYLSTSKTEKSSYVGGGRGLLIQVNGSTRAERYKFCNQINLTDVGARSYGPEAHNTLHRRESR